MIRSENYSRRMPGGRNTTSVLCFNETLQTSNAKASVKQQPIQMYLLVKDKGISSRTEPLEPTTFQKLKLKSL